MKKIILTSLIATLALTACDKKQAEAPAETTTTEAATPVTEAANTSENTADTQHNHDHDYAHDHSHEHDDHAEHDHDHDHAHDHGDHAHHHHHHDGDKFQCGDKNINIAVHNHEGEIEAHLTADDITYDLNQDPNDKKRFTTDEGIEGDGKPMTLILDGNKAQVLGANNAALLDCTKS